MKLPQQKKIMAEDIQNPPPWLNIIIDQINQFFNTTYQTLNKNVDENNTASQVKELTVITTASYPTMAIIEFKSELRTKALGLQIMQIIEKGTYSPVAGYLSWTENNGIIQIHSIVGLSASKTYLIRVRLT